MERKVSFCDCGDPGHQLILEVDSFKLNDSIISKEVIVFYRLNHYLPFWPRFKHAIAYLLKKDVDKIDYHDIVISNVEELKKLKDVIDEVYEFNINKK